MSILEWTVVLLMISLVGELLGTATVAINYYNGAQVAREMREALRDEEREFRKNPLVAALQGEGPAYYEHELVRDRLQATRERVAAQLSARWYLTFGLVALAVGSVAGFLAALINVV
jgi:hypothetical protein